MRNYNVIKREIIFYIISGVVLSVMISSIIIFAKYGDAFNDAIVKYGIIRKNLRKMKEVTSEMEVKTARIENLLPSDYDSLSHKELILILLEKIKRTINGATLKVQDFLEKDGDLMLPLKVSFPFDDYTYMVEKIDYLEALRFPYFFIDKVVITYERKRGLVCNVDGSLRIPAEKLTRS